MNVNMLIADDEPVICQGLSSTIPWNELRVNVVGEAYNGREALEVLERVQTDIVLTDIRMPEMDGLELVKHINGKMPDTRVIMISGYDDFDYARQALRLGVKDYLLKPVDIDELTGLIRQIVSELNNQRREKLERWLLMQILDVGDHVKQPDHSAPVYGENQRDGYYVVCSQLYDYASLASRMDDGTLEALCKRWKEEMDGWMTANGWPSASVFAHNNLLVSIVFANQSGQEEQLIDSLTGLHQRWKGSFEVSFTVSTRKENSMDCKEAYHEASSIFDLPFIRNTPVECFHKARKAVFTKDLAFQWESRFMNALFQHHTQELSECADELFKQMKGHEIVLSSVWEVCRRILLAVSKRMQELGLPLKGQLYCATYPDLRIHNTYERLRKLFGDDLTALSQAVAAENQGKNRPMVEKAKAYILQHLNENLKAAEVAEWIHVTPNYFSQIFKQETGKTFNKYVNELKVDKAKELLALSNDKVFEIAEKIGYCDYKHFVSTFKKMTGLTPSSYRELLFSRSHTSESGK